MRVCSLDVLESLEADARRCSIFNEEARDHTMKLDGMTRRLHKQIVSLEHRFVVSRCSPNVCLVSHPVMVHFGSSTSVACDWIDRWVFQGISDAIKFIGKGDTNAVAVRENTAGKWMPLQLLLRWNARGVGGWRQRREECFPLLLDALQGVAVHSHKTKPCTDGCLDSRSPPGSITLCCRDRWRSLGRAGFEDFVSLALGKPGGCLGGFAHPAAKNTCAHTTVLEK